MSVADMWACLQDHDPDNHWRHVAGWRKISELADQHLHRLRTYRQRLARAWPPDTNEAARAYLAELDDLIAQVQRTHDAASANQSALTAATQAITSTRTELKKIHDEYADKLRQKRGWEQTAADPKAVAGSRNSRPPVTDADLEQLNVRARGIMYGLSSDLQQAQVTLRRPPPLRHSDRAPDYSEAYSPTGAPAIPPIVPAPLPAPSARFKQPRPAPQPNSTAQPSGPLLSGNASVATPPPTNPVIQSPLTPNQPPSPGMTPPASPASGPNDRPKPNHSSHSWRPSANSSSPLPPPAGSRFMHPNGLIGGLPSASPSQSTPGGTQPRRVNPIGGVIGGGAAGTAPAGGAGSRPGTGRGFPRAHYMPPTGGFPAGMVSGNTSGRPIRDTQRDEDGRKWDPDHPWQTEEGVDPIVLPPRDDGPIDPGPAIGSPR
ncbi:hypothetical protein EYA84_11990 [Verrucosispora sp. SN26_14.1]|nr:hypothetical protein [Verrucosispora sp. SN26_14.1]TBL36553.1 hypothetical protein EYA84_11990 [Verrucosispora sp. SN26_14.1]